MSLPIGDIAFFLSSAVRCGAVPYSVVPIQFGRVSTRWIWPAKQSLIWIGQSGCVSFTDPIRLADFTAEWASLAPSAQFQTDFRHECLLCLLSQSETGAPFPLPFLHSEDSDSTPVKFLMPAGSGYP